MNVKRLVVVLVSAAVFVCAGPRASAGVGGQVGGTQGGPPPPACGAGATLYTNSTPRPITFDLSLSNIGGCTVTLSWTDATGHPRTFTVDPGYSQGVSSISVAARSVISWASASTGSSVLFQWELERVTPRCDGRDD
jgi:hypothetical protein